jgi:hypothetical protein
MHYIAFRCIISFLDTGTFIPPPSPHRGNGGHYTFCKITAMAKIVALAFLTTNLALLNISHIIPPCFAGYSPGS